MTKNDYISRNRLFEAFDGNGSEAFTKSAVLEIVEEFPKASVEEIEEAAFKVTFGGSFTNWVECSRCGNDFQERTERPFDRCPYCGARRAGA